MACTIPKVSSSQDPARLIADRVARRLAAESKASHRPQTDSPNRGQGATERPRARVIDFVSPTPPASVRPSIGSDTRPSSPSSEPERAPVSRVAQSPWLAPFAQNLSRAVSPSALQAGANPVDHPSQERFGVEEAAVSELVEFFENEKQCSVDPSGKPCDHCAMCSSRGF